MNLDLEVLLMDLLQVIPVSDWPRPRLWPECHEIVEIHYCSVDDVGGVLSINNTFRSHMKSKYMCVNIYIM